MHNSERWPSFPSLYIMAPTFCTVPPIRYTYYTSHVCVNWHDMGCTCMRRSQSAWRLQFTATCQYNRPTMRTTWRTLSHWSSKHIMSLLAASNKTEPCVNVTWSVKSKSESVGAVRNLSVHYYMYRLTPTALFTLINLRKVCGIMLTHRCEVCSCCSVLGLSYNILICRHN